MLAHGLATNPLRATRCPVTSRASTAPLGLVSSLGFDRGCKDKVKLFVNADRYIITPQASYMTLTVIKTFI
jgi:hypothetical protein